MRYINLTPHEIEVYHTDQFVNLTSDNKCYYADKTEGEPVLFLPSEGTARIYQLTAYIGEDEDGVPLWKTHYGELELPDNFGGDDEVLIVSLPTKRAATDSPLSRRMVSPYGVVRSRENSSLILGCQGFTY